MRILIALACVTALLGLAGCGGSSSGASGAGSHRQTKTTPTTAGQPANTANGTTPGPEGMPLEAGDWLGSYATTTQGSTVDGIQCAPTEQVAYHIHAHLQVYLDGLPRALPGGIGIVGPVVQQTAYGPFYQATGCYYWLHTHTSDGVIHVESPSQRIYTLGDFFDEWRQPLSADQVASLRGHVSAVLDGKPWRRSPRAIPLIPQAEIQLAVGQPVPPFHSVSWSGTSL